MLLSWMSSISRKMKKVNYYFLLSNKIKETSYKKLYMPKILEERYYNLKTILKIHITLHVIHM